VLVLEASDRQAERLCAVSPVALPKTRVQDPDPRNRSTTLRGTPEVSARAQIVEQTVTVFADTCRQRQKTACIGAIPDGSITAGGFHFISGS